MKTTKIIYWTATGLLALGMSFSCYMDLTHAPELKEGLKHLGYPLYLADILGTAKLLGVIVLLTPFFKRLKEWAYAGFVFDLIGAIWSHSVVDGVSTAIAPILFSGILAVSYFFYHKMTNETNEIVQTPRSSVPSFS